MGHAPPSWALKTHCAPWDHGPWDRLQRGLGPPPATPRARVVDRTPLSLSSGLGARNSSIGLIDRFGLGCPMRAPYCLKKLPGGYLPLDLTLEVEKPPAWSLDFMVFQGAMPSTSRQSNDFHDFQVNSRECKGTGLMASPSVTLGHPPARHRRRQASPGHRRWVSGLADRRAELGRGKVMRVHVTYFYIVVVDQL